MATTNPGNKDYISKALDIASYLILIFLILFTSFKILSPFLIPVVWGIIIAVALHTPYEKLRAGVKGSDKAAGTIFILFTLALILVPTVFLADSVIDGATGIARQLDEGTLQVPPAPQDVKTWPLVGESLYETWQSASVDLEATIGKMEPQIKRWAPKFADAMAGLGGSLIQTIFALIIAGIFLMNSAGAGRTARAIGRRIGGEEGAEMINISAATIRSVVKGVVMIAALQGVFAAIGLYVASVPGAGFWALLVMVIAVMQLPPILILGPIAMYVFSASSTTIAVFFLIWSLIVSGSDGILKPMFLGRGVRVPMLVILIGAIGGMLSAGIVGLFLGAVILSIGYELVTKWMENERLIESEVAESPSES